MQPTKLPNFKTETQNINQAQEIKNIPKIHKHKVWLHDKPTIKSTAYKEFTEQTNGHYTTTMQAYNKLFNFKEEMPCYQHAYHSMPEVELLPKLIEACQPNLYFNDLQVARIESNAKQMIEQLKQAQKTQSLVQNLMQEFSLSSHEGIALMCLAEALLRIPDVETRDALIRDKILQPNWENHLGHSSSLFVNAATWGLVIGRKWISANEQAILGKTLGQVLKKSGEVLVRKGLDVAMQMMGQQFVCGQTIEEGLKYAAQHPLFNYSFDMLGEAALTDEDAQQYMRAYENAIHAIGRKQLQENKSILEIDGISIKLSALHARYDRFQYKSVIDTLYPRLLHLVKLAYEYQIGINIDAEETDRLEISLALFSLLAKEPSLVGYKGLGFVVQAYQKRALNVLDDLLDLAKTTGHKFMIRLVKGAYWDSEIAKAQQQGLQDYPVFTQKKHTDINYIACALYILHHPDYFYGQFATHNALTASCIMQFAEVLNVDYEFQCLHGMGETLYEYIGKQLGKKCRVYAPIGSYQTLLPYLVRRLLENGANSSFVHQIASEHTVAENLATLPTELTQTQAVQNLGAMHPFIALPENLYPDRPNSHGLDMYHEITLKQFMQAVSQTNLAEIEASYQQALTEQKLQKISQCVDLAIKRSNYYSWQNLGYTLRAQRLQILAKLFAEHAPQLVYLIMHESGKTLKNAHAELREALDFLNFYRTQALQHFSHQTTEALGVVVCISPWNFPLAIFMGQIASALMMGNAVLAKPAPQSNLIAHYVLNLCRQAGLDNSVLDVLYGGADIGHELVHHFEVDGIIFTGSTEVAKHIQLAISQRLNRHHQPVVLVAETAGQNCMLVDSSVLLEQTVNAMIESAFDYSGQRCSALRIAYVHDCIFDEVLNKLKQVLNAMQIGASGQLNTDIAGVIDAQAVKRINEHLKQFKQHIVYQKPLSGQEQTNNPMQVVAPTILVLNDIGLLNKEVFGPVLHLIRYKQDDLNQIMQSIQQTGYGLTLGIHSRINKTIENIISQAHVGNIYINRNMIGAVVGVQPFGGENLSGTGPKAGGFLYLSRLLAKGHYLPAGWQDGIELAGPTGQKNTCFFKAKTVVCYAKNMQALLKQLKVVQSIGAKAIVPMLELQQTALSNWLEPFLSNKVQLVQQSLSQVMQNYGDEIELYLCCASTNQNYKNNPKDESKKTTENMQNNQQHSQTQQSQQSQESHKDLLNLQKQVQQMHKALIPIITPYLGEYQPERLLKELSISDNTSCMGGNASLMLL